MDALRQELISVHQSMNEMMDVLLKHAEKKHCVVYGVQNPTLPENLESKWIESFGVPTKCASLKNIVECSQKYDTMGLVKHGEQTMLVPLCTPCNRRAVKGTWLVFEKNQTFVPLK